jgi:hypothetical protein
MTTLTINIDEKLIAGRKFIHFLKSQSFVSIVSEESKSGIDKALEDVKNGQVFTAKNTKDLMKKTT